MESGGLHEILVRSIRGDMDVRREMFGNVVLSGGTTSMPVLAKRLAHQLPKGESQADVVYKGRVHGIRLIYCSHEMLLSNN
ncbi:hypothetical protein Golob_018867 [Gossypium lobatum]|uniref:Actin n=1 Tax=Gossypium lobatum TaxID=34289 RepID=A0A7J8L5W8_9ROSI|nr:hypothetical protein [Gossypium lobatum]